MSTRVLIFGLTSLLIAEGSALAEGSAADAESETVESIAGSVVRNVRRSIAIGPTLGVFGAYAPSASEIDVGISFGLELEIFKSKIPTPARVREIAKQKTQEKLEAIIRDRFGGQRPDEETLKQLIREIAAQVKAEVLAALRATPPLIERPRFSLFIEPNYLFDSSDWLFRLGVGVGVGPVSVAPTFSVRFGSDTVARLGAELSLHLLPTKSPRSPVLDILLRGDFELHARDTNDDQLVLGVRPLLDLL
jgi:hypothetical protein